MRIIRSSGGREACPGISIFFEKLFRSDSGCPTRAGKMACMKHYSTRYRRPTLLPVPYSYRPDRLERGLRMLRALRLSLAATPAPVYAQQREFQFVQSSRAR